MLPRLSALLGLFLICALVSGAAAAKTSERVKRHALMKEAQATIDLFRKSNPDLEAFFNRSSGYAVFPKVTKAGVGLGGARGKGVVYDLTGTPIGLTTLTQFSVGVQLGAQSFSEIIFFKDRIALEDFKRGNFEFDSNATARFLEDGAGAHYNYNEGVAVFTRSRSGLMFEASLGGQQFSYEPLNYQSTAQPPVELSNAPE